MYLRRIDDNFSPAVTVAYRHERGSVDIAAGDKRSNKYTVIVDVDLVCTSGVKCRRMSCRFDRETRLIGEIVRERADESGNLEIVRDHSNVILVASVPIAVWDLRLTVKIGRLREAHPGYC